MRRGDELAWLVTQHLAALGERLRDIRVSRGWSRQELANCTGLDRSNVSNIECGKQNITLDVLWRLAEAFYLHWADLLGERTDHDLPDNVPVPFEQQLASFGTRAYQAGRLQRLTQETVAARSGIARSRLPAIESGAHNITMDSLSRLAAALDVHRADLLNDRTPDPPMPTSGLPRSRARTTGQDSKQ